MEGFQKCSIKDAIYAAASAWNKLTKGILVHACHIWPTTSFSDDDEQIVDFDDSGYLGRKKWCLFLLHMRKVHLLSPSVSWTGGI